ncbi:WhiB family transcriptional regulator [Streptomyces roseus]|uniref:WhiB family transcriptional regulator n=1 Tax=Streptomyces roseus TaxID=66430 RepID=UPI003803AD66
MTRSHHAPNTLQPARHWATGGLCRSISDPDAFFPTGTGASVQQQIDDAKQLCSACPIRMACATTAIRENYEYGVWGGLDERQRRYLSKVPAANLEDGIRRSWDRRTWDPYFDAYAKRTVQVDDGHVLWTVKNTSITVLGRNWTPRQLAIWVGQGREPHGTVKTHCGHPDCVAAEHVGDAVVRMVRARQQSADTRSHPCGTRAAALRHKRRAETLDDACLDAYDEYLRAKYAKDRDRRAAKRQVAA